MQPGDNDQLHPKILEDLLRWSFSMGGTKDQVSKILRLHALTESYLDRLLTHCLKNASVLIQDDRFSYHHKRVLAGALGVLPPNVLESLKRLTQLRNRCAHSAFPEIAPSEIQYVAQPIDDACKIALTDHCEDGVTLDEFGAYSWALFSEITLRISPIEACLAEDGV